MYLKIIKVFIALFGLFLISPIVKYQPDIPNVLHTQDSCTEAEAAAESETEAQETARSGVESITLKTEPAEESFLETDVPECGDGVVAAVSEKRRSSDYSESEVSVKKSVDIIIDSESVEDEITSELTETSEAVEVSQEETNITQIQAVSECRNPETIPETITAHVHSWTPATKVIRHEAVYRTIHHESIIETVWVEDKPAWDETYENTYLVAMHAVCKGCGIDFNEAGMTDDEMTAHDLQHILNGEDSSYYEVPIYQTVTETVHHEAEGHYEEQVVQEAYDETVLVSEAWDEEVITGYVCEECGEIQ